MICGRFLNLLAIGGFSLWLHAHVVCFSEAGFSSRSNNVTRVKIGPGSSAAKLDKNAVGKNLGRKSLDRMKANYRYANLTDDQIQEKVRFLRKGIICSIELIKKENREVGEGLERLYLTDGICIGLAPKRYRVKAEIRIDNKAGFTTKEPINVYFPLCEEPILTSFELFQLFDNLSHEGLHGTQKVDYSFRPTLAQAKDIHDKEIDAHQGQVDRLKRMKTALEGIIMDGKVPADTSGAIRDFADAIAKSSNAADLAKSWLAGVKKELQVQMNLVEFRGLHKTAACLALDGETDFAPTHEQLKKYKVWFDFYKTQGREWSPIAPYFTSPPPKIEKKVGSRIPEITGEAKFVMVYPEKDIQKEVAVPGMDTVGDGLIVGQDSENPRLLIGGWDISNNQGVIVSYDLDPADGALIDGSEQEMIRTDMVTGFEMAENESGDLFVLNRSNGAVCRGEDTDKNGLPDRLVPSGYLPVLVGTEFGFPQDFFFVGDNEIFADGFQTGTVAPWSSPGSHTRRNVESGNFEHGVVQQFGKDEGFSPTVTGLPYEGLDFLEVGGTAGATCTAWFNTPGQEPRAVGSSLLSWCGSTFIQLDEPINATDSIILTDSLDGGSAEFFCVPAPTSFPDVGLKFIPGGIIELRTVTYPGDQVRFFDNNNGLDGDWQQIAATTADAFGNAYFPILPTMHPGDGHYFRCEGTEVVPPPVALADTITIVPGITTWIDVTQNDPFVPPGTRFILTKGPDFPESVFLWSNDGKIEITMPTFAGPLEFEYRPVRRGILGEPVQGIFEPDVETLKDPIPYNGPDGTPWVRVPVLVETSGLIFEPEFNYPLYQFTFAFSIFDECVIPHWHWRFGTPVYSFEAPLVLVDDPDPPVCGYGTVLEVPIRFYQLPQDAFKDFADKHP
ncbi:MAG: hypothetical protein ACI9R3_000204 [Verrucomicrobiales bacterium]|jgi:hypothetical protein